jgi:tRNA-splicing ligase RtcB
MIRMLDHTADVGFEVFETPALKALFDEVRQALLMTVFEKFPERGEEERDVRLSAPDLETLLVRWINELVFFIQGDGFVPISSDLQIQEDDEGGFFLKAHLAGAPLDLDAYGWQGGDKERDVPRVGRDAREGRLGCSGDPRRLSISFEKEQRAMNIEHISGFKYRITKEGKMRVDATFYASKGILEDLKSEDYASLQQICNVATLPGVIEPALTMPDIHWGYGFPIGGVAAFDPEEGGVVSPGGVGFDINCGVRLLVSEISREEVDPHEGSLVEDPQKNRLADALYEGIPSGVGKGRKDVGFSREDLEEILVEGASALVERGYGEPEDLENIESGRRLPGADPIEVSDRAYERGVSQLGTLGSGNHFLEVQYIDEIYDEEAVRAFNLRKGQVTVLIHSGSRGLGHQVCQSYVERCMQAVERYEIELEDRQLAAAPVQSPEGEAYLKAMAAAANFAFANRQLISHFTRQAFERAGFDSEEHRLRVLYDLAHNNAKFEEHDGREVLVHRKGATRAFGPGNKALPERYRSVGQPVLVPGDMGRYSFVLVGTEGAMSETFGSSAHGAGRKMGRRAAKRAAKGRNLKRELEDKGILIRAASKATIDEEMSEAYKDATEVVDTTDGAGIGKKVVRLRPLIVVKG